MFFSLCLCWAARVLLKQTVGRTKKNGKNTKAITIYLITNHVCVLLEATVL